PAATSSVLSARPPPCSTPFPYTTLFRSCIEAREHAQQGGLARAVESEDDDFRPPVDGQVDGREDLQRAVALAQVVGHERGAAARDRKSTRLNSSHVKISYAVFCLKKKKH